MHQPQVLEVAGEVPCIGGLARVLLMLRDGVAAVQVRGGTGAFVPWRAPLKGA